MTQSDPKAAPAVEDTQRAPSDEEIWAELEAEENATQEPEEDTKQEPEQEPSEDGADAPDVQDAGEEPPPEPEPEPEEQPRAQEQAQDDGTEDQQEQSQQAPEWWDSLPEEGRNEIQQTFKDMQDRYNALHGRVAPVQRQLSQAIKERDDLKKQLEAHSDAPASLEELEKSKAFKALAEDFPEDAAEIKKAVAGLLANSGSSAVAELEQAKRALAEERETRQQREIQRLTQAHPDWANVRQSQEFAQWASYLSPQDQQTVQQMLASPFADENIAVLNAFKQDMQASHQQSAPTQSRKPQERQPSRNQTSSRRQPPSASPPSGGSGVSGSRRTQAPQSEEDLFADVTPEELDAFRRRGG